MKHLLIFLTALALGALSVGCFGLIPMMPPMDPAQAQAMADQQVDAVMLQRVNAARQAVQSSPGAFEPATVFSRELESAYQSGTVTRGALDGPTLLVEAVEALQAAAEANPPQAQVCQALEGTLLIASGDVAGGVGALERSMDTAPNLYALPALLAQKDPQADAEEIEGLCVKTLARVGGEQERFAVLDHCQARSAASGLEARLAWASEEDRAFYGERREALERQQAAEAAEAERKRAEERERMQASFAQPSAPAGGGGGSASGGAASGPSVISITIRSRCPKTAKVFYGDKPKYGSGTRSTVSTNSVSSHSFRPGDMFWLTDDSEKGLASVTVSAGMREITINADCAGLSAK